MNSVLTNRKLSVLFLAGVAMSSMIACEKNNRSFSILADSESFQQSVSYTQKPIDVLWVIDNSGSMMTSQSNLTSNFQSFIQRFESTQQNFHMAVTSTDAWKAAYVVGNTQADIDKRFDLIRLRDGGWVRTTPSDPSSKARTHSGVHVMSPSISNLASVFLTNATQGIDGTGDERAFQSIRDVLSYSGNNDFVRVGANLAVIIVSDEDDFSSDNPLYCGGSPNCTNQYTQDPQIHPVDEYKGFLDDLKGAGNYNVHSISIMDDACRAALEAGDGIIGRKVGVRYQELSDLTGGVKASLCDPFGATLDIISEKIMNTIASFVIDRDPVISTLKIIVNGQEVPNDSQNGWTFDPITRTVTFHGNGIPPSGASISVSYDPLTIKN